MTDYARLKAEIERRREEIRESVREGSERVQTQWRELESQWGEFAAEAHLRETGEGLEDAVRRLGDELVKGYRRVRDALAKERGEPPLTPEQRIRVERLAHELWEQRGRPEGSAETDWKEAERRVREEQRAIEAPHG